jgi:hypothetical protein
LFIADTLAKKNHGVILAENLIGASSEAVGARFVLEFPLAIDRSSGKNRGRHNANFASR